MTSVVVTTPYDYLTAATVCCYQIPTLLSKLRSFRTTRFSFFVKTIVYF
jgi:hypothetical protein